MATSSTEKKGHICPPSNAKHPSDRWEAMFIYSFICKFTQLRGKIEGLETPMDFENALLSREPTPILTKILARFVLNLRPQTRNLSPDQISTTVATVLSEYFKSSERTVFWDDDLKMNVDPFDRLEGGIFAADWDFKLKILRQLVELQLCHTPEIKNTIDRAWGVVHNKHKKKEVAAAPPDADDPNSQERLQCIPLGQDIHRKRYWVADDSPRIYVSTNPWKTTATFQTLSSTKEDYLAAIEELKASSPQKVKGRLSKLEHSHLALISALEGRIEAIDAELGRVQRVRRKIEQRQTLYAQAEVRETRTRRQTQRPDYVYSNDVDSEDDADEYTYHEEDRGYDDEFDEDDFIDDGPNKRSSRRASAAVGYRRSTRTTAQNGNGNGKRESQDTWSHWRGERRSSRLGAPPDTQLDLEPPPKRARTEESTMSTGSMDASSVTSHGDRAGLKVHTHGAAAVKPTEIALEQVAGKKKSKFWYYAVEPIPGELFTNGIAPSGTNGYKSNGDGKSRHTPPPSSSNGNDIDMDRNASLEGSLSPVESP